MSVERAGGRREAWNETAADDLMGGNDVYHTINRIEDITVPILRSKSVKICFDFLSFCVMFLLFNLN